MMKLLLITATAASISSLVFTELAIAQSRGDRTDRATLSTNQLVAQADARIARFKADLRLTLEQEKNWLGFENTLHEVAKNRADRMVALRAEREQQTRPLDVIEFLNGQSKFLAERSTNEKKLADAAQPLYESLDEKQKRRFSNELIRLSRE